MKIMIIVGCAIALIAELIGMIEVFALKNVSGRKYEPSEDKEREIRKEGYLFMTAGCALAITCLASGEIFFPKYWNLIALLVLFWCITQLTAWGRTATRRAAQREAFKSSGDPESINKYNHGKKIKK